MIFAVLISSIVLNLFLIWFIYRCMYRISDLTVLLEDMLFKIGFFSKHLKSVYELEMFYGEPTLESIIEHSKELIDSFENFKQEYALLGEEEIDGELQEET